MRVTWGRKIAVWILAGMTMVTGCGKNLWETGSADKAVDTEEAGQETMTLEVYAWTDEEENVRLLSEAYKKEHENIEIHMNIIPISQFSQRMLSLKNGQIKADCVFSPNTASCPDIWKIPGSFMNMTSGMNREKQRTAFI